MGEIVHEILFHLMNCGKENLICRMPWLDKENPIIDWKGKIAEIKRTTDHTTSLMMPTSTPKGFSLTELKDPPTPTRPQGKTPSTQMKTSQTMYKKSLSSFME